MAFIAKKNNLNEANYELLSHVVSQIELDNDFNVLAFMQKAIPGIRDILEAYDILGHLHQKECELLSIQDTNYRKHNGVYYTPIEIAKAIVLELFSRKNESFLKKATFLEPCVGGGIFILCFVDAYIDKIGISSLKEAQALVNRIYCADIDSDALRLTKALLRYHIKSKTGFGVSISDSNFYSGNLLFDYCQETNESQVLTLDRVFGINKADIILTNPPYKLLKLNSNKYSSKSGSIEEKSYSSFLHHIGEGKSFSLQSGVCNYYKLFCEAIFRDYISKDGFIGVLIPNTFLNDQSCSFLRKFLLANYSIGPIRVIPENNEFFSDICQGLCFFCAERTAPDDDLEVIDNVTCPEKIFVRGEKVSIKRLELFSKAMPIVLLTEEGWDILSILRQHPMLSQISNVRNLRGELDLTINKKFITKEKTSLPLITGKCIDSFDVKYGCEYVLESFLDRLKGKRQYVDKPRLVCQQISNMLQKHRLKFAIVKEPVILGNSCNFITEVDDDSLWLSAKPSLYYLLGILNSLLADWQFRLTSSNNHVNNYELDALNIAYSEENKSVIETLAKKLCCDRNTTLLAQLNIAVFQAYELSKRQIGFILDAYRELQPDLVREITNLLKDGDSSHGSKKSITDKDDTTKRQQREVSETSRSRQIDHVLYNHESYPLSTLDMRMVRAIPPGGNWQDIPLDIPSKRLEGIRATGGRTTLYGRLSWDAPSYTVTTFFNRPGNGCYIHPSQDRVISAREAARLQSFPDDYIFKGSKTSLCKQIGNAVPPLMAFAIAREIANKTQCRTLLDLFCGAGGLSLGFSRAGFEIVAANDIFHYACETYRHNHPNTTIVEGDITSSDIKKKLIETALEHNVDIIVGGPPCQGFSYAGQRMIDDPRNFLYREFVEIVSKVSPLIFVMENVEGILTSNHGKTYQSICSDFSALGYSLHGRKLFATWFGVPQKRKRVIIIGTRNGYAEELYPKPILTCEEDFLTVREAIENLPEIPMGGGVSPCTATLEDRFDYERFVEGKISFDDYYALLKTKGDTRFQDLPLT